MRGVPLSIEFHCVALARSGDGAREKFHYFFVLWESYGCKLATSRLDFLGWDRLMRSQEPDAMAIGDSSVS